MGKNIGTLGKQREPWDLEFTYFGEVVRVHPQATDAIEIEFLDAAGDIDLEELQAVDMNEIEALPIEKRLEMLRSMNKVVERGHRALMSALHNLIHPDDFDKYWKLGVAHGQQVRDRMADVRAITAAVVEATTDFPTGQQSDSPPGPSPTPPSSAAGSPSRVAHPTDLQVALALERGRPDIQEFYVMEAERVAAEQSEQREATERERRKLIEAGLPVN